VEDKNAMLKEQALLTNTIASAIELYSKGRSVDFGSTGSKIQRELDTLKKNPHFPGVSDSLATQIDTFNNYWKQEDSNASLVQYLGGSSYIFEDTNARLHRGELVVNALGFRNLLEDLQTNIGLMNGVKTELLADGTGEANVEASLKTKGSVDEATAVLRQIYALLGRLSFASQGSTPFRGADFGYPQETINFTGGAY
jgi:hypothetical protein